jgi:hypothetical protein
MNLASNGPFSQNETGVSMGPFWSGQALSAGVFVNSSFRGSWLRPSNERILGLGPSLTERELVRIP